MVVYNISASPDFSSVLDLTGVVDTRRTSIEMNGCSTAFSSAEDTASFTIRNIESPLRSNAITMLLDAYENGTDLYGRIMDNGRYLFSGMVDLGGISLTSTSLAGPVTVKLVDLGRKYLDVAPKRNIVIENVKISTVVTTLLGYAGCTVGTISIAGDDDATLPCFVVDRDGNETYRNILDRLLLETGLYYLWFDSQGRCNVSAVTLSADSGIVPNYRISSGLQTTGSKILESKGLRVQWSTAAVKADQIIYVDNISKNLSEDGRSVIGTEILEDSYYPVDGDVDPIYQEYSVDFLDRPYMSGASRKKNTDLSLLMARDVTVYLQFTDELGRSLDTDDCVEYPSSPFTEEPVNPIMYAKKAFILMRALQDCYILHFQLRGTIRYRDVSYISSIGDTSSDPIDYTSEYIFSKAQAEKFAQRYWQMKQMSRLVHKWTDLDDLAIGSIVQIAHRDTAVSQYAYIVSRTSSFVGGLWQYEYTAVSIGSWNAGSVATRGSSLEKGRQGDVTIQYAWSSSSTTPPVDGWTAQPTARTDAEPYQWMRTSTDDGLTWAYSCITGADGLTVQYEYQYGDDADNPPTGTWYTAAEFPYAYETYNIVWGSSTCLYNGDNMVMAADAVRGTYLWQRISSDGGTTWTYIRLTGEAGEDAKYFRLSSTSATFEQNARKDGNQTIDIALETSGYATVSVTKWQVKFGSGGAYADIAGETGTTLSYSLLPYRNSYDTVSFRIVADCDGTSTSAEISLGVLVTTNLDCYWGALASAPTGTATNRPIDGDYYLNTVDSYPYVMSGGSWVLLDANSDTDWGMKVANILANAGDTLPSDSSLYTWCRNLVAKNGFIENLETKKIHINSGGAIYTGGFDENGNNPNGEDGAYISENTSKFAGEVELMQNGETVFRTQRHVSGDAITKASVGPTYAYAPYLSNPHYPYRWSTYIIDLSADVYNTFRPRTYTLGGNAIGLFYKTYYSVTDGYTAEVFRWDISLSFNHATATQTVDVSVTLPVDCYLTTRIDIVDTYQDAVLYLNGVAQDSPSISKVWATAGTVIRVVGTAGYHHGEQTLFSGVIRGYLYYTEPKVVYDLDMANDIQEYPMVNGLCEEVLTQTIYNNDGTIHSTEDNSASFKNYYYNDLTGITTAIVESGTVTHDGTTLTPVKTVYIGYNYTATFIDADDNSVSIVMWETVESSWSIVYTETSAGCVIKSAFIGNFVGMVQYFLRASDEFPPDGWLLCDGTSHLKADYPKLWATLEPIGLYGDPNDPAMFVVPDLMTTEYVTNDHGRYIVGGSDTGRKLLSKIKKHRHAFVGDTNAYGKVWTDDDGNSYTVVFSQKYGGSTSKTASASGSGHAYLYETSDNYDADSKETRPESIIMTPFIYHGES